MHFSSDTKPLKVADISGQQGDTEQVELVCETQNERSDSEPCSLSYSYVFAATQLYLLKSLFPTKIMIIAAQQQ